MRSPSRRLFPVSAAAALASPAVLVESSSAAQFAWKCGTGPSAQHPLNIRLTEAFGKIRTDTKGALDIKLFPSSALGSESAMVSQLRLGALEMMADPGDVFD